MAESDEHDARQWTDPEPVEVPINGELDLHNFHPRDARDLVDHYLRECVTRGIHTVRIIHGKGTGQLKAKVTATLDKHPLVVGYGPAGHGGGNWGATLVDLGKTEDGR